MDVNLWDAIPKLNLMSWNDGVMTQGEGSVGGTPLEMGRGVPPTLSKSGNDETRKQAPHRNL